LVYINPILHQFLVVRKRREEEKEGESRRERGRESRREERERPKINL
jgi:hypothetical protein